MKKILHLIPFILYTIFYLAIILLDGSIENLVIIDVVLLLAALLICGLGTLSNKKTFNLLGIVSLFGLSFGLIKMGIENTYFMLVETKVAITILLYYLIIFFYYKVQVKMHCVFISKTKKEGNLTPPKFIFDYDI